VLCITFCTLYHWAGGAGNWFRPSGLFAVLLTQLPGLKEALVEPLHPEVAVHEPEMALSCLALLEAGVRWVQHRLAGCLMVGVGCGRRGGGVLQSGIVLNAERPQMLGIAGGRHKWTNPGDAQQMLLMALGRSGFLGSRWKEYRILGSWLVYGRACFIPTTCGWRSQLLRLCRAVAPPQHQDQQHLHDTLCTVL
jgi:hypothetical protein